jgi:hypothetical protein
VANTYTGSLLKIIARFFLKASNMQDPLWRFTQLKYAFPEYQGIFFKWKNKIDVGTKGAMKILELSIHF